ncbi:MAG: metalloregulator ArsR/SmtB family transcription factor [Candidatus Sericytochromatia bacterium]|nr:metalloregulator ArsR/SmtB family transcription factor [Candidatus Sericytochromatia bacterium]MEB3221376.1 metalloregulator ArsR/SmtB family transcription factor [Candidatus Sericytochromatia bacterium]
MSQAGGVTPEDCCSIPLAAAYPPDLAERARRHRALGDVGRLKVLYLVRDREVCVCDLVAALGIPQGTLSHHLAVLQRAGLVRARRQGRWNYYQATDLALGWLPPALAMRRA